MSNDQEPIQESVMPTQKEGDPSMVPNGISNNSTTAPNSMLNKDESGQSPGNAVTPAVVPVENTTGLRRSTRVHKPRTDISFEEDEIFAPKKHKKKKKKVTKKVKGDGKKTVSHKSVNNHSTLKITLSKKPAKLLVKHAATPTPSLQEPILNPGDWTSNVPLLSSDFKTHQSVVSRLKSPNMKSVPYAGDVIKSMTFVNKFNRYFAAELQNLSFQDYEIGLDLYPEPVVGKVPKQQQQQVEMTKQRKLLYQDYIPVKEVIGYQDKMNLLFLSLLNLIFTQVKKDEEFEPITLNEINSSSKKAFAPLMTLLRERCRSWGYPREWRSPCLVPDVSKPISSLFPVNDNGPPVDPNNPEILTRNIYTWFQSSPVPLEDDPIQNPDLDRMGILALNPADRIVLLRALTDWCSGYSTLIHNEIYHLSHFKKDQAFGVHTQHVPRYFVEGAEPTFKKFVKLTSLVQARFEIRSKKKHFRKLLKEGKNNDFGKKLEILKEIKDALKNVPKEEKEKTIISLYDKWAQVFEGELNDNPLNNPFDDELYKLRSQEFFIGRVPHMGDFYLPRLQTYCETQSINTFTDLRTLKELLQKFSTHEYNTYTLFENYGQLMSAQFKLFYHDSPSLIRDTARGVNTVGKVYWYEMCHDSKSLKEFLEVLDYKIALPKEKEDNEGEQQDESAINEEKSETSLVNKHPLPKDARYNTARNKLKMLHEYLSELYYILVEFEQLKVQYADMNPGKRQLRRMQTRTYTTEYDSEGDVDADSFDGESSEEYTNDRRRSKRARLD